jgi:hypothetical protein
MMPMPFEGAAVRVPVYYSLTPTKGYDMSPKYSLAQMRAVWLNAYFEMDIEQLDYVEAGCFFVKDSRRVVSRQQQLLNIRRQKENGERPGTAMRDIQVETVETGTWATVQGTGQILDGNVVIRDIAFVELWIIENERWRVAALCYDEAKER